MPPYCLDADTFIQAKNRHYAMDVVPAFWSWLDQQAANGAIFSPMMVYDELAKGNDELAEWVKARKGSGLFVEATAPVQAVVGEIADYVNAMYRQEHAQYFLEGADAWVTAHAKVGSAIVVTHETLVAANSRRAKIPNICQRFDVPWIDVFQMLRDLGARF